MWAKRPFAKKLERGAERNARALRGLAIKNKRKRPAQRYFGRRDVCVFIADVCGSLCAKVGSVGD